MESATVASSMSLSQRWDAFIGAVDNKLNKKLKEASENQTWGLSVSHTLLAKVGEFRGRHVNPLTCDAKDLPPLPARTAAAVSELEQFSSSTSYRPSAQPSSLDRMEYQPDQTPMTRRSERTEDMDETRPAEGSRRGASSTQGRRQTPTLRDRATQLRGQAADKFAEIRNSNGVRLTERNVVSIASIVSCELAIAIIAAIAVIEAVVRQVLLFIAEVAILIQSEIGDGLKSFHAECLQKGAIASAYTALGALSLLAINLNPKNNKYVNDSIHQGNAIADLFPRVSLLINPRMDDDLIFPNAEVFKQQPSPSYQSVV